MNNLDIICFDFETTGLRHDYHDVIQVAGKAYNCRSLEAYPPDNGEFVSLMKPLYFDRIDEGALRVNKITRKELEGAPDQKVVWNRFVEWVGRYNPKGSAYMAPIAAGKNIRNFDLKFVETLNKLHCLQGEKTVLFNNRIQLELEDFMFSWFENSKDLPNLKMDTLRKYFGLSTKGAHSALVDVSQTGELLMRFLRLHRSLQKTQNIRFKGACC